MAEPLRYQLQRVLVDILGSKFVYYQPPLSLKMTYPCIVYSLDNYMDKNANNSLYFHKTRYQVTVIDRNPDSEIPMKLNRLPHASLSRTYTADDLYHFVFHTYI